MFRVPTSVFAAGAMILSLAGGSVHADYSAHPAGKAFAERMLTEHGMPLADTQDLLSGVSRYDAVIEAMSRPAEKTLTWADYRPIFLKADRAEQGAAFYREHRPVFDAAASRYGVPAEIITAIIGVESRFGRYKGKHPALQSLATLAFDYPPRSAFFTSELEHFLLLSREEGLDPLSVKGSYAAAMGMPQFISSSYRAYAVDGDGDGQRDLFNNIDDVVHSVANYFARHGWRPDEPVTTVAAPNGDVAALSKKGYKPTLSAADLDAVGVAVESVKGNEYALIRLRGANGDEHWVGYPNFYVITRYNHSPLYAMAVFQLAQAIKKTLDSNSAHSGSDVSLQLAHTSQLNLGTD